MRLVDFLEYETFACLIIYVWRYHLLLTSCFQLISAEMAHCGADGSVNSLGPLPIWNSPEWHKEIDAYLGHLKDKVAKYKEVGVCLRLDPHNHPHVIHHLNILSTLLC